VARWTTKYFYRMGACWDAAVYWDYTDGCYNCGRHGSHNWSFTGQDCWSCACKKYFVRMLNAYDFSGKADYYVNSATYYNYVGELVSGGGICDGCGDRNKKLYVNLIINKQNNACSSDASTYPSIHSGADTGTDYHVRTWTTGWASVGVTSRLHYFLYSLGREGNLWIRHRIACESSSSVFMCFYRFERDTDKHPHYLYVKYNGPVNQVTNRKQTKVNDISFTVSWSYNDSSEHLTDGVYIAYKKNGGSLHYVDSVSYSTTSKTFSGLSPGKYEYFLAAYNSASTASYSACTKTNSPFLYAPSNVYVCVDGSVKRLAAWEGVDMDYPANQQLRVYDGRVEPYPTILAIKNPSYSEPYVLPIKINLGGSVFPLIEYHA